MKSGGHFNCWTEKRVNEKLLELTGGDAHVERGYNGEKPERRNFATFSEYSKACDKSYGYICFDSYRPGMKFWGKTPREAALAAFSGFPAK